MILEDRQHLAKELMRVRFAMLRMNDAIRQKQFRIPIHLGLGHESIAVAVNAVKGSKDSVLLSHRNMHYNLAFQPDATRIRDEYLLAETGRQQGRFGSMNLIQPEEGIPYTSSILGNNLCVAVGVAKANQIQADGAEPSATFVVTGDGAMEEGAFYESLLMAKTCAVPMIVIVENNGWSMYTQIHERRVPIDVAQLANSMGVIYAQLDGNDTVAYTEQLGKIRQQAIASGSPAVVEVLLHTLGDYYVEDPNRRLINYHHGLAPKIEQTDPSIVVDDAQDPLFVMSAHFDATAWEQMETEVRQTFVRFDERGV